MELLRNFVDLFLNLDKHLAEIIAQYGNWTYLVLFLIVFAETGLVVTPFLPGDSLLFAIGSFAALDALDLFTVQALLIVAAILGDTVNYHIGKYLGPKVFHRDDLWYLNKKHLLRTQKFYDKHGGKTVVLARFVPIVRTFAPFIAGVGSMRYRDFIWYNVVGALVWVLSFTTLGYFFGNMPIVKKNFTLVILAIIVLSVLPAVFEFIRAKREEKKEAGG
jgi:membrane-associated protein